MDEPSPTDRTDRTDGPDRIEALEERLSVIESAIDEMRDNLLHVAMLARAAPKARSSKPATSTQPDATLKPAATTDATAASAEAPPRKPPFDRLKARLGLGLGSRSTAAPDRPRDLESWFGQNALLVVGVLALVAAVAFTLKYAFDQGWVSPAARVGAGLVAGVGIAAYGERLIRRGLGRFGAGLQGGGAAIAYLSTWAAAGPFQFVPAGVGIAALAIISGLVLLSALRHSEQYLAGLAAAGAYIAPILLGEGQATGTVLLAYSLAISAATCAVAVLRGWRGTFLVVILGYFLMALVAVGAQTDDALWVLYLTVGGGALLTAAFWRGWHLEAGVAWLLAWGAVLLSAQWAEGWRAWAFVIGPAALVWPVWRRAIEVAPETGARLHADEPSGPVLTTMFYATAIGWAVAATEALPPPADAYPLATAVAISLLYLLPGVRRGNPAMHLAGLGVLAIGVIAQWDWLGTAAGLSVLAVFAAATTRTGPLAENRWSGTVLAAMAVYALFGANAQARPADDPALVGRWAATLYLVLASIVAIAGPLWKTTERRWEAPEGINLRLVTWLLAAVVALSGGTIEIPAFVIERGGSELPAGLAVSVYWLLLAGGLLAYGFWKDLRGVRITGLAVAALAIGKVLFVDLSELQALYRVGSLALLAVIALLAARAYHRRE